MREWTKEEDDYLKNNHKKMSNKNIALSLNMNLWTVENRITHLKLGRDATYSQEDDYFIMKNHSTLSNSEIARHLNRSLHSIQNRIYKLGIGKTKYYSQDEDDFIRKNCISMTYSEIAIALNRTEASVQSRFIKLGLKNSTKRIYSEEDLNRIKKAKSIYERLQLAYEFGVSYHSLCRAIHRRGCKVCPIYARHKTIISRCYNKNDKEYKNYGGRGISVCDEWLNDDRKFVEWAINNEYEDGLTIDRIDVNGNYYPENCRWSTVKEQSNNTRKNVHLTAFSDTKTLKEWSEDSRCLVLYATLCRRIKNGFLSILTPEEILTINKKELYKRKKQSVHIQ